MGLFSSLFKSYSEKQIKKITPIVDEIEALAPKFKAMADEELRSYTDILKGKLKEGKTLDDILPEAFALVREADERVLGKRPYRVQLMGGIILHQGRIAEMKTGEGKTLVATMPAYLNALSGNGVHVVTVNDYLAERDSEEMGKVYSFLGLTTGLIIRNLTLEEKKKAYACDITYAMNSELGFDYLRDNMARSKDHLVQRGHSFAIVDEVDSILIDEARTPLIISGMSEQSTDLYEKTSQLVRGMSRHVLREMDTKNDYDFSEDHFYYDALKGTASITESSLSDVMYHLSLDSEDIILHPQLGTHILTEKGRDKILAMGEFSEDDLIENEESVGYLFTAKGASLAEKILNRTFIHTEAKNTSLISGGGAKKLMKLFGFNEDCFARPEGVRGAYALTEEGRSTAEAEFSLSEKDFVTAGESGISMISDQGVARIGKHLDFDYIVDEKGRTAVLSKSGIEKAERFFGVENLASPENGDLQHQVNIAIRAFGVMERDVDYIVKDGDVIIVDANTGRLMPGRRYSDGLHQAIEAKEGVKVQKDSITVASITYQNFFRMYTKLSGMTGTALTEENEFKDIYALDVVEVPTNKPMIRKDHTDLVFGTRRAKLRAVIEQIKECHEKGQPVLVGTVSVERSEELSALLKAAGIPHNVLNAKQHSREAAIVANAGTPGAITISTNMAGRGTDIMLGGNPEYLAKERMRGEGYDEDTIVFASGTVRSDDPELLAARETFHAYIEEFKEKIKPGAEAVRAAGGLFILGTERHDSRRIDNQLRGRSGRQGDPGESRFFISFDDDLIRLFMPEYLRSLAQKHTDDSQPIEMKMLSDGIEKAQKARETRNFSARKQVLSYDDVMNQQRAVIYKQRRDILLTEDMDARIRSMIEESLEDKFEECCIDGGFDAEGFMSFYRNTLKSKLLSDYQRDGFENADLEALKDELLESALSVYESKKTLFAGMMSEEAAKEQLRRVELALLLNTVDQQWAYHLEAMDDLKGYVGLNSYAQRDPITVYRIESAEMFDKMTKDIREKTVRGILMLNISFKTDSAIKATGTNQSSEGGGRTIVKDKKKDVKRNAKCPCGSNKKYKDCCWKKDQV